MASQGKISRIASLALLVLISPLILLWIIVQLPVSVVQRIIVRQREKRFAAEMRATGRLVTWADARSQLDNQHGTFIEETVSAHAYRIWWTPDDVSDLSPYPCCLDDDNPPELWEHILFDEWCRSRFTSPESGTAQLVDIRKPEEAGLWDSLHAAGKRYVRVR